MQKNRQGDLLDVPRLTCKTVGGSKNTPQA
jgi:hypothetical protein